MVTVTTEELARNLKRYLDRAQHGERVLVKDGSVALALLSPVTGPDSETDEAAALSRLEAEGTIVLPKRRVDRTTPRRPLVPARGRLASEMVVEDRS